MNTNYIVLVVIKIFLSICQVKYDNDISAALISFSTNEEAARAYHSSEPVFNNRFIKLFWHRGATSAATTSAGGDQAGNNTVSPGNVHARLGPVAQQSQPSASGDLNPVEVIDKCLFMYGVCVKVVQLNKA